MEINNEVYRYFKLKSFYKFETLINKIKNLGHNQNMVENLGLLCIHLKSINESIYKCKIIRMY